MLNFSKTQTGNIFMSKHCNENPTFTSGRKNVSFPSFTLCDEHKTYVMELIEGFFFLIIAVLDMANDNFDDFFH